MDLCAVSRWCEGYRNKGKAQSSSALDRISEWITPTFQTLSRPEIIRGSSIENEKFPYISITYGGESVSQLPLQDNAFSTFLDQNPPFELRPENGVSLPTKACSANGHRQQCHQATSERQIAVAPTSLIAWAFALRRQRSHVRIVSSAPLHYFQRDKRARTKKPVLPHSSE